MYVPFYVALRFIEHCVEFLRTMCCSECAVWHSLHELPWYSFCTLLYELCFLVDISYSDLQVSVVGVCVCELLRGSCGRSIPTAMYWRSVNLQLVCVVASYLTKPSMRMIWCWHCHPDQVAPVVGIVGRSGAYALPKYGKGELWGVGAMVKLSHWTFGVEYPS